MQIAYESSVFTPAGWRSVTITAVAEKISAGMASVLSVIAIDGEKPVGYTSRTGAKRQQFNAAGVDEFAVDLDTIDEEFVALLFVPTSEADGLGGAATGTPTAQFVTFYGTGDRPTGWVNNCVE